MEDEIRLGDRVRTRKFHPCGGDTWVVTRTGADIKIRCETCGRVVMLDRLVFLKRRKATLERGPEPVKIQQEGAELT
ncbi:MAG: DUF951 domain-containing protein [Clostridia bacterium]|nr:DUF951 domain-containing protein [Clostridia bacterium]